MNRKQLLNFLKIAVSIGLLTFIFSTIDIQAFLQVIRTANLWWLLAAFVGLIVGVVFRAWRWKILLDAIGVVVPIGELTAIYFIGFLFNNILPSGLGGDAIRMIELNRHSERASDAVTSVLVDRFLGLSALQAIALVALLFNWNSIPRPVAYFTVAIFVGGLVGALEVDEMVVIIRRLRDQGVTIFVIEHIMRAIMALSDRIVVIHFGRKIAEGTPQDIAADENVIKAYLGEDYAVS